MLYFIDLFEEMKIKKGERAWKIKAYKDKDALY
jgi:hypothetical protein